MSNYESVIFTSLPRKDRVECCCSFILQECTMHIRKSLKTNELVIASTSWDFDYFDLFHKGTINIGVFDDAEHIQKCLAAPWNLHF